MEEQHDTAAAHRLVLLIAVVFLTVSGAVAFGRVFQGPGSAVRLGIAAGVAVLLAGALERRNVLLAAVVSGAGLAVMIGWLIFPETTKYLLPTATTYRATLHAWRSVGRIAAQEVAPTLPLDPLFLAALTAVWTAAFSSHVLAVRARSPLLALVPPGALLAFTSLLLDDGPRPLYVATFLAAAMAVLFADSLRRVGHWGPLTMWHGRRRRLGPTTTLRGARRIALACLGLAVFFPGILPGFHDEALIDVHAKGAGGRVSIDPIVDIRPALLQTPVVELFQVRSSNPSGAYWRLLSLDRFDGRRWTASNPTATGGVELKTGALSSVSPSGADLEPNSVLMQQHVVLERLGREWLPAAYDPILLSNQQRVRWDPVSSTLVATDGTFRGFSYDITSQLPEPTREQLDLVANEGSPGLARYTQLPRDVPEEIYRIAHQISDGKPTMYQKVFAIQQFLRNNYRYDQHVPPGHDVNHILYFLTQSKAGYCEQFAGTMAVLLRALGIPARVAVGFTPGTHDPKTGAWHVTTRNAHTWVEVFFSGQGWLAFEPTPSRFNPVAQGYTTPAPPKPTGNGSPTCLSRVGTDPDASCATSKPGPAPTPTREPRVPTPQASGIPRSSPVLTPAHPHGWRWWALRAVLLLGVLFVLSLPLIKLTRRRLALAMASAPRERVLAAYRLMADQASDLGLGRRSHETMWEYRSRLKGEVAFSDGHLDRLTNLAAVAAYSEGTISAADADQALDAARVAARDMARSKGAAKRLVGLFRVERAREDSR